MPYLIKYSLISTVSDEGKLYEYDDRKVNLNKFDKLSYIYNLTSLYNGGNLLKNFLIIIFHIIN